MMEKECARFYFWRIPFPLLFFGCLIYLVLPDENIKLSFKIEAEVLEEADDKVDNTVNLNFKR